MKWLNSCLVVATVVLASSHAGAEEFKLNGKKDAQGVERYLFGSLHHSKKFLDPTEQGLFVYDINDGHRLVGKFPSKTWESWSGGWAGLAADAGRGVLFQVQDGSAIRAYDVFSGKLLWESSQTNNKRLLDEPDDAKRLAAIERGFTYIDRRFDVTKDGKYVLVPDRDSAKPAKLAPKKEEATADATKADAKKPDAKKPDEKIGLGLPVIRVLDAKTGHWVKNIALVGSKGEGPSQAKTNPHSVLVGNKYIYATQWNDGHVYCIDPVRLEVVKRIGPVVLYKDSVAKTQGQSEGELRGAEEVHGSQSIQHFTLDPAERYVYVEPVKAFGLGMIDIESGKFLGQWPMPAAAEGSVTAARMAVKEAKGNQLHSKANHGIASRPNSKEVWMTDDNWGLLHIWDASTVPPKYVTAIPVFDDINKPIFDYSWVNFSIDGKYAYASNKIIDADTRKMIGTLNGLNEASIEIQVKDGKVIRTGHDGGIGPDTWLKGYELSAKP